MWKELILRCIFTSLNMFTVVLCMQTLSSDACEFDEVIEAIPHDQSYTHEGLHIKAH